MKLLLPKQTDGFQIHEHNFCGLQAKLVVPNIDAIWNSDNLFYRSVILDSDGNVLSSGWPKFFNQGEKTNLYPDPEKFDDWSIQEKLDGSLLIADFVNNQFSMRTRGCASYLQQENSNDFELLPKKFPKLLSFLRDHSQFSLLFEIVTPNNVIVIRSKEIEFYLIGAIDKSNMIVASHQELLDIWRKIGCPPTPKTYRIENIKNLASIEQLVKTWKGSEGVVVTFNKNQNRVKIKSDWYLFCQRVKSQLNSQSNLIDYYVDCNLPPVECFYEKIQNDFDFEIAIQLKEIIEKISTAGELVKKYVDNILEMVHDIRKVESRKEQADMIKRRYGPNSSYAFSILDNKPIAKPQWIKLINQKLESQANQQESE